ncbi:general stress protein [Streptomyces sp. NPDC001380]|uniref:general stress protein n=1 Tax=Streptomyces sp. NPDC001380 TaxID=3364566 RepID=UPI0036A14756
MTAQDRSPLDPVAAAWNTVGSYGTYEEAQAAVDRLSDEHFPVENLDIVGSGLRLVEHVTGRLTRGRAAAAGAASGAWFGLFIGLLVGLFTSGPAWFGLILGGLLIGALWGAVFGFVGHAATGGRRDFSSTRSLVASRYDVIARGGRAEEARTVLGRVGLGTGAGTGTGTGTSTGGRPPAG